MKNKNNKKVANVATSTNSSAKQIQVVKKQVEQPTEKQVEVVEQPKFDAKQVYDAFYAFDLERLKELKDELMSNDSDKNSPNYDETLAEITKVIEAKQIEFDEAQAIKDTSNDIKTDDDLKASLDSITENYTVKIVEVETNLQAIPKIDYSTAQAKDIIDFGKKLEVLQKSKTKLEKERESAILKAKRDYDSKAKERAKTLENASYEICLQIAKLENDSFNLNVSANAYNQQAIWKYNAYVSLDGLFDTEKHSKLIEMLELESKQADEMYQLVKEHSDLLESELKEMQLSNAHLLELSVMKRARKDARAMSDKLFASKLGERPSDEQPSDETNEQPSDETNNEPQVEEVVLDASKRDVLKQAQADTQAQV